MLFWQIATHDNSFQQIKVMFNLLYKLNNIYATVHQNKIAISNFEVCDWFVLTNEILFKFSEPTNVQNIFKVMYQGWRCDQKFLGPICFGEISVNQNICQSVI